MFLQIERENEITAIGHRLNRRLVGQLAQVPQQPRAQRRRTLAAYALERQVENTASGQSASEDMISREEEHVEAAPVDGVRPPDDRANEIANIVEEVMKRLQGGNATLRLRLGRRRKVKYVFEESPEERLLQKVSVTLLRENRC
jgi:hypothetical protein